jgi:DNA-binding beta-propeller fold protein YncE
VAPEADSGKPIGRSKIFIVGSYPKSRRVLRLLASFAAVALLAMFVPGCSGNFQFSSQTSSPPAGSDLFLVASLSGDVAGYASDSGQLTPIAGSSVSFASILDSFAADPGGTIAVGISRAALMPDTLQTASIGSGGQLTLQGSTTTFMFASGLAISSLGVIAVSAPDGPTVQLFTVQDGQIVAGASSAAGVSAQDLAFSPSGNFLYVGDGGKGIISVLGVSSASSLQLLGTAQMPVAAGETTPHLDRLRLDSAGDKIAAITEDGRIFVATVNPVTGLISNVAEAHATGAVSLGALAFDQAGTTLYTADFNSGGIYEFSLAGSSPQPIAGSPVATPVGPVDMVSDSSGDFVYVAFHSSSVSTYSRNAQTGALAATGQSVPTVEALPFRIVRVPAH